MPLGDYHVAAHAPGVSRSEPVAVTVSRGPATADVALPRTPATERVSLGSDGRQGNHEAWWPELSGDGSVAVFASPASNLDDDGDTNGELDVFATDLRTRVTERVSVPSGGGQGDAFSLSPTVSQDGRYVGFNSGATNLVPGDGDGTLDVFVRDRRAGTVKRVRGPYPETGGTGPVISSDGTAVAFSNGPGLGELYVHYLATGQNVLVSVTTDGKPAGGMSFAPSLSADGRKVAFYSDSDRLVAGDANGRNDAFVRDVTAGTTVRVSAAPKGADGDGWTDLPSISDDGRYVVFSSTSANLVEGDTNRRSDVFLHDLVGGPEALFAVAGLRVVPSRRDGEVQVRALVKNVGERAGSYEAVLRVNGVVDGRRTVTLDPDRGTEVAFDVRRTGAGTYTVELGPLTGRFTVGG